MRIRELMVAGLLLGIAACDRGQAPVETVAAAPPCALTVGWDPWEPYQYEGADGAVRGLDIEIIRQLAGDAGCRVEFTRGSWQELMGRLRDGDVDVLMAASATEERRRFAHFTQPYRRESFALYTRTEDAPALAALDLETLAMRRHRIAVTDGYYYGEVATQLILGEATRSAFVLAPVVELNYTRLVGGEVDALLDDPFVAAAVLRRKGMAEQVMRHPLEIHSGDVSLMISKAGVEPAVVERLEQALQTRKNDGSLDQLIAKYQG